MAVYDINGDSLQAVYGLNGSALSHAYDIDGTEIFPDEPPTPPQLRFMQYNVGGWYIGSGTNVPSAKDSAFYALQNGIISTQDADILCIEEYWDTFSGAGRTALSMLQQYYPYIQSTQGNTQYWGRCICSKYPIASITHHTFQGDSRGYDEAVINVNGENILVVCALLNPTDNSLKASEATEIFNTVSAFNGRYVICGDFNSTIKDPFSETNHAIYDQFLNADCTLANGGAFGIKSTYSNQSDWSESNSPIDNIICSDGITITDVWTDLTKTTNADVLAAGKIDHIPLIAEVEL